MIVKKTFSTLLMALPLMAAMTSCSDNDVAGNAGNSKSYIGFDVQTSRKTRGTVSVLGTLQAHKQFKTYSYNTGTSTWADYVDGGILSQAGKSNPFENQVITYENGKWDYKPWKLWPQNEEKLTFLSYWAGQQDNTTEGAVVATPQRHDNKPLTIKFNQFTEANNQVDFLTAVSANYTEKENEGKVKVHFNHITTRLSFGVKLTKPINDAVGKEIQAFVTGVKLLHGAKYKLYSAGTYTFGKDTKLGSWSYEEADKAAKDIDTESILDKQTHTFGKFENQQGIKLDMGSTTAVDLFKGDVADGSKQYLFLIPPSDKNGIENEGDIVAQVTYKVAAGSDPTSANSQLNTYTADVALPKGTLKAGVAYRINFSLNVDGNVIKIDPEVKVENWDEDIEYTEAAQAIAPSNDPANILRAWNQLAKQNADVDQRYEYYLLKVNGTRPDEFDVSTGNTFKNGAIINVTFTDGKLLNELADDKIKLPAGFYLDKTETDKNWIRKKEPVVAP